MTSALIASIIIPNYNGKKWLELALPSLINQEFSEAYEIIVVDNASSDGSVKYVEKNFPQVKIVKLDRNFGYAGGCNEGTKHARGAFIIIINQDVEADRKWLSELIEAARKYKNYELLASRDQRAVKRDFNAYLEVVALKGFEAGSDVLPSLFASGACFLTRREWIMELGYLFEPYFYFEDAELSLRTVYLGGEIGYAMKSRFNHYPILERGIRSIDEARRKSLTLNRFSSRNKMKTIITLFSLSNSFKLLIVHFSYVLLRCFVERREPQAIIAMIRGTIEGISEIGKCAQKHRKFQKIKRRPDSYILRRLLFKQDSLMQRTFYKFLNV